MYDAYHTVSKFLKCVSWIDYLCTLQNSYFWSKVYFLGQFVWIHRIMVLFNPSDDLPLRKSKQRWIMQNMINFDKIHWIEDSWHKINEYSQVLGSHGRANFQRNFRLCSPAWVNCIAWDSTKIVVPVVPAGLYLNLLCTSKLVSLRSIKRWMKNGPWLR